MPLNTELASKVWYRYQYARDNGHADFIKKADLCDKFFAGDQWTDADRQALKAARRPALTINKIISTIGNVMGEQIYNRAEISFRPKSGAPSETADALNKVFKHISTENQLDWRRSDMFADGIITSRGFLDVRLDFNDSQQGEVRITNLNAKNVIIDPDGEDYDPDTWNEVLTTKWLTADDIAILYSKEDAELLRNREQSFFPYGYDSIDVFRDRFGYAFNPAYASTPTHEMSSVLRNLRVIERQHRTLDRQEHFINPRTGDMRAVPEEWERNRIALVRQQFGLEVIPKLVKRIRWTVICDNVVLHDDWSPYKHFTVVPYFPYFRRGKTIGLVENLLGPQELLNKVSSQELHIVNTTANSGYKVKAGALANMSIEELETKGAQTGLVVELNDMEGLEKIQPNQVPQGLDRISYKAEEHITTISGMSESRLGQDREDVSGKAIQQKRQASSTNFAKPLDSLVRSDYILARNVLDIVQEFYTEERIVTITHDTASQDSETVAVNQVTPEGEIVNDLTLGEYEVQITSVPQRETLEDSLFEQVVSMRKDLGISIPDEVIIDASRAPNKKDIIQKINEANNTQDAQQRRELEMAQAKAEVDKTNAEVGQKNADAGLKQAKAQKEGVVTQKEAATPPDTGEGPGIDPLEQMKVEAEIDLSEREFAHKVEMDNKELELKEREAAQKRADAAVQARVQRAAQPTNQRSTP